MTRCDLCPDQKSSASRTRVHAHILLVVCPRVSALFREGSDHVWAFIAWNSCASCPPGADYLSHGYPWAQLLNIGDVLHKFLVQVMYGSFTCLGRSVEGFLGSSPFGRVVSLSVRSLGGGGGPGKNTSTGLQQCHGGHQGMGRCRRGWRVENPHHCLGSGAASVSRYHHRHQSGRVSPPRHRSRRVIHQHQRHSLRATAGAGSTPPLVGPPPMRLPK